MCTDFVAPLEAQIKDNSCEILPGQNMGCWAKQRSAGWVYPTTILSLYGFFANCRVAEPFLTPYLIGPHKNISEEVVTNYLFPIWTYSYLAFLFPVFLLTDFLRYKPLIIVQGLFLISNYVLLCFAPGLPAMTFLQVNYAVATSTEVAYFSYIYSVIPLENYQKATGYIRSATLAGYTFGASLGQMLISLAGMDYFFINAVTLGFMSVAFLISLWLPMPTRSMFFKGKDAAKELQEQGSIQNNGHKGTVMNTSSGGYEEEKMEHGGWCSRGNLSAAGHLLWGSFRESYSSKHLVYWSLWWALATAGYMQIFNYIQLLWDRIEPSATSSIYNGGVEAVSCVVGAAAAFSVGFIKVSWVVWGELALGLFSAVAAGAVFLMAFTSSIWACYAAYVMFKSCYMFLITITIFQIASNLSTECYALTFGINTFIVLCLQTIFTVTVVDEAVLGLDIVTLFIIYGSYYAAISLLFLIRGIYSVCLHHQLSSDHESNGPENRMEVVSAEHF
ncbi:solute carrier family 19 member 3b [Nothobranchius furzeri]|uniref:Solute carrier family 19 member 3b n=1 Tax=Nothobranchius furzeri TaxID=105023 RepID=A0A8C6LW64_NOTFU|nr:solute carrier family 19 member 3b [Nothobranchius furzeri]